MKPAVSVLVAVVAVVLVAACGGSNKEDQSQADRELTHARAQIQVERKAALSLVETLQSEADDARDDISTQRSRLSQLRRKVARERRRLSAVKQEAEDSTIPGEGTFEVGKDIQPGTYRADAQDGCYWARLSSLSGDGVSNIIQNDNADGPVAITIEPSDAAFQANDCADFHREGG